MTAARVTFCGWCADLCRALGRHSLVVPKGFERLASWFDERAR